MDAKNDEFCTTCINFRQTGHCPLADIIRLFETDWANEFIHVRFQVVECSTYMAKDAYSLKLENGKATLITGGDKADGKEAEDCRSGSTSSSDSDESHIAEC